MRMPDALQDRLAESQELHGSVLLSLRAVEPILKDNKMPFFPEYTDHGTDHVEKVLCTASSLISDDAWKQVTAEDAAVLVLAVLLHDLAMHTSEHGFITLVGGSDCSFQPLWADEKQWPDLWLDFLSEASRFDGRKLIELFGDPEPADRPTLIPDRMTGRDRLLIGEFLRRHHHRLAHEIAQHGFPGSGGQVGLSQMPAHIAKLAGLVARSHGMPIRACFPYLEKGFDVREYKGVHCPFLMSLLRISDYLQIEEERAPRNVLRIKQLQSPISRREWNAHHAIKNIHTVHDDPEAIFVHSDPQDVKTFLRVQEWLSGVQQELDSSWAVLGEVYGRYGVLSRLGFVIRRVRSNLDDLDTFSKSVSYVPIRATFEAANPDLLKLLIGPLYGYQPEIGVRELVQNAVDAVRELREYQRQKPSTTAIEQMDLPGDVLVLYEKDSHGVWWLTVSDHGIGMTADTVQQYYLRAGASYRRSDAWRSLFEDETGQSRVVRAGRFGIGALAAFLLGSELQIRTRHVESASGLGLSFKTTIDEESVELVKVPCPVGTSVRIRIAPDVEKRVEQWCTNETNVINADTYCLTDPRVVRIARLFGKKEKLLKQKYQVPGASEVPDDWGCTTYSKDNQEVHWTYSKGPDLACNGFVISQFAVRHKHPIRQIWSDRSLPIPRISIMDPDGRLPLNLQRTSLASYTYDFVPDLILGIAYDYLAFALVRGPESFSQGLKDQQFNRVARHQALDLPDDVHSFVLTSEGYSLFSPWNVAMIGLDHLQLITWHGGSEPSADLPAPSFVPRDKCGIVGISVSSRNVFRVWVEPLLSGTTGFRNSPQLSPLLQQLPATGRRILIRKDSLRDVVWFSKDIAQKGNARMECDTDGWEMWATGESGEGPEGLMSLGVQIGRDDCSVTSDFLAEWDIPPHQSQRLTAMGQKWKEILGGAVIPYDPREREKRFADAYKLLASHIQRHRRLANDERQQRTGR